MIKNNSVMGCQMSTLYKNTSEQQDSTIWLLKNYELCLKNQVFFYKFQSLIINSTNFNMEINKQKISQLVRRLSPPDYKSKDIYNFNPLVKDFLSPKKQPKKRLLKNSSKINCDSKRILGHDKSYIFNKTTFCTPYDKSTMLSYVSTPNQKSFNVGEKMRAFKCAKKNTIKTKQCFNSTQDQNYSQQTLKVNFVINGKKIFSKHYANFVSFQNLKEEFAQQFSKQSVQKNSYHSLIGFQVVPFNYGLFHLINESSQTFQYLLNHKIRQISLSPILLIKPLNYDFLKFKDFQIVDYLGSGGFSEVYLAKCKLDSQYCALKFIKKDTITSAKKLKMLENQKSILFSIKHKNLIDLYYAFETKNYIIFGLEYCPNGNLYNYVQKMKMLSQEQAKTIFFQILQGLEYLHENNILFRDVKLENILFDIKGRIKITDFGLSKPDIEEDQITYSYCGSPEYMAPQMLAKSGHSYQVDYYALGILLYELLFGRSPFYAPKKQDIFFSILNSEPKFPKSPSVSKQVKALIKGLLAKNPKHRIGSLKGIKEISSHPWLRGYTYDQKNTVPFIQPSLLINNLVSGSKQNKKIKEQFEQEKVAVKFNRYFFQQSYVNQELMQKLEFRSVKLGSNTGFSKLNKSRSQKKKLVKSSSQKKRMDLR